MTPSHESAPAGDGPSRGPAADAARGRADGATPSRAPGRPRSRGWYGLLLLLGILAPAETEAGPTHRGVAGAEYAASGLQTLFLGRGWRDLWTTPIEVPILDLGTEGDGLEPVKRLGGHESILLAMKGADGRSYTFRALEKQFRILPPPYEGSLLDRAIDDQVAAQHPVPNVVVAPLAAAAGVPMPEPRLVVLPADLRLGEFADFAGRLGTIEEYPTAAGDGHAGTMGATEIVSTMDLWERCLEGPEHRADSRAYLRARLLDLVLNDWDRHLRQWRWARIPDSAHYQPIPEDRDQAFSDYGGLLVRFLGPSRLQPFRDRIPDPGGLTRAASTVDRWILADRTRADFLQAAAGLQAALSDQVIAEAMGRMPPEYQRLAAPEIAARLRRRRDGLVEAAERFYRHLAGEVDVHASNRAESGRVTYMANGAVEVTLAAVREDGTEEEPHYRRTFAAGETREVRVYLHDGEDRFVTAGNAGGGPGIFVMGGPGADRLEDPVAAGVRFLEVESADHVASHADRRPYVNPAPNPDAPWREPRNWGTEQGPTLLLGWGGDLVSLGLGYRVTRYGFRHYPHAQRHLVGAAWLPRRAGFRAGYEGSFRRRNSGTFVSADASWGPLEQRNFFGFGNETPRPDPGFSYRISGSETRAFVALAHETPGRVRVAFGPELKRVSADRDGGDVLIVMRPYGGGTFGQAGARLDLDVDRRSHLPAFDPGEEAWMEADLDHVFSWSGYRLRGLARAVPALWDVERPFQSAGGSAAAYLPLGRRLSLASRVGGRKVWGRYPWHEAAFLGGGSELRSWHDERFAGDASVFGNAELRWNMGLVRGWFPGHFGVLGFAETGRVFLAGEDSDEWHQGAGGGVFFAPYGFNVPLHVGYARSRERSRVYLDLGFSF